MFFYFILYVFYEQLKFSFIFSVVFIFLGPFWCYSIEENIPSFQTFGFELDEVNSRKVLHIHPI